DSAAASGALAKGMERSAKAAEISAAAGRDALALNRRSLVLSYTPYLQLVTSKLQKVLTVNEQPSVMTTIINGGRGTAFKAVVRQWIRYAPSLSFEYSSLTSTPSVTDIVPGMATGVNIATV